MDGARAVGEAIGPEARERWLECAAEDAAALARGRVVVVWRLVGEVAALAAWLARQEPDRTAEEVAASLQEYVLPDGLLDLLAGEARP